MSERVYKWYSCFGRSGSLEGIFVATEAAVKAVIGKRAHFGEVLGKHSDVSCDLMEAGFQVLSEDSAIVAFIHEHGPFGLNPLDYITVECDDCGNSMRICEEQDYYCTYCEFRICYHCKTHGDHNECEVVEYDDRDASPEED